MHPLYDVATVTEDAADVFCVDRAGEVGVTVMPAFTAGCADPLEKSQNNRWVSAADQISHCGVRWPWGALLTPSVQNAVFPTLHRNYIHDHLLNSPTTANRLLGSWLNHMLPPFFCEPNRQHSKDSRRHFVHTRNSSRMKYFALVTRGSSPCSGTAVGQKEMWSPISCVWHHLCLHLEATLIKMGSIYILLMASATSGNDGLTCRSCKQVVKNQNVRSKM